MIALIPCTLPPGAPEGQATAPGKVLRNLLGKLGSGPVVLRFPAGESTVLTLEDAHGGTVKLQGLGARDFPRLLAAPAGLHDIADPSAFRAALEIVSPYISTDETRQHLTGVCFAGSPPAGLTRLVATDGHRISKLDVALGLPPQKEDRLLPRPAVLDLLGLLGARGGPSLRLGWDKGHLFAQIDDLLYVAKLAEAQFPPYAQVIPRHHERAAELSQAALRQAIEQTLVLASEKTGGLLLLLARGVCRVRTDNPDLGDSAIDLPCRYEGEPFAIGVNGTYLHAACKALAEPTLTLQMCGALDPILIKGCRGTFVIMPMRDVATAGQLPVPRETLPDFTQPAAPAKRSPARKARMSKAAPEVADTELSALCAELAERPLETRAACLAWLQEVAAERLKRAQEPAPAGLRLVYSAPKVPGVRQPQAARRGKVRAGKAGRKVRPTRAQIEAAGDWDW